ncbi:MAG: hypothetical protein HY985_08130 [Magnetospirillum sp.]|nr:hypothetical protein [Magnetospirillum sp.]
MYPISLGAKGKAMRVLVAAVLLLALVPAPSPSRAADWTAVDQALGALEPVIGHYPPDIASEAQKRAIMAKYRTAKAALDKELAGRPSDLDALHRRARLQVMGHHMDLPNAFKGAERDFAVILDANPTHERAILDLANLWVNTGPQYAPKAEMLYRAVQCLHDTEPQEEAQRGLFFSFYYQGRIEEAKRQTEFLVARWPDEKNYRTMDDMVGSVLERRGQPRQTGQAATMVTCG